jgi:hypothetical protein
MVSQSTTTVNNMCKECPFCDNGSVDLFIATEYVETIKCPECDGTGKMPKTQFDIAMSGIMALEEAFADEQFKY